MNWSEIDRYYQGPPLPDACYVFGIHKCGSTLLHDMVGSVCDLARLPKLNIPRFAFNAGIDGKQWSGDPGLLPVFGRGRLYFGFRFLPSVLTHPDLKIREKRFVLLVRDPRDALVSQFFSYGGKYLTHPLPEQNADRFLQRIQKTADLDIDAYVLARHDRLLDKMKEYRDNLDFSQGLLVPYP